MDPELRGRFNADFSEEKYGQLVDCVNRSERWPADFRVSETPIFLTKEFTLDVVAAADEIGNVCGHVDMPWRSRGDKPGPADTGDGRVSRPISGLFPSRTILPLGLP